MELRHLRYFIAVGEHLHFGRAAEQLHISQPPLTRQIKQLEQELDVALFIRTNRRVDLTAVGQRLLAEAKPLLVQFESLKHHVSETAAGRLGKLAIGFISVADYHVLPSLLREFQSCYPNVTLNLREATTDLQLDSLRNGEIDIGIALLMDPSLQFQPMFQEELVAVLPSSNEANSPPSLAKAISVRALAERPFVMFPRQSAPGLYDAIVETCDRAGFAPRVAQEAIQMQTIISLVSVGMGVALVPASLTNLGRAGVIYRPLKEKSLLVTTGLAWKNNNSSPTLRAFLDLVEQMQLPPNWQAFVRRRDKSQSKRRNSASSDLVRVLS
ncbi:MAG: LysR family transcriptional regulator [Burkholderiales bacterium]